MAAKAKTAAKKSTKVKKELSDSEEDDKPLAAKTAKKATPARVKKEVEDKKPAAKRAKKVKEEEEDEEKFKWWEQGDDDGSVKWTTLVHNAVLFPPAYVPLPKGIKMKYDGQSLTLPHESEEVAGFFGAMLGTDHAADKVFQANFFRDFKAMVEEYPPVSRLSICRRRNAANAWQKENIKVKAFEKCDFTPMFEHFESEKEKKKSMTKDEKKA